MIRLGTSSYIIEEGLIENVRYLAPFIDDVELLLFETPTHSNIPSQDELVELNALAKEHNLTYTVHLPMDIYPGSLDETVRSSSVDFITRVLELTGVLNPFGYILHFTPEGYGPIPANDIQQWKSQLYRSSEEILRRSGIIPRQIGIETLSYPLVLVDSIIEEFDFGVTIDIGHLHLLGYDVNDHITRYLDRSRIFHLHGVEDGVDHQGLDRGDRVKIGEFLDVIERVDDSVERVITVEVFDQESFEGSMGVLHERRKKKNSDVGNRGRTKWEVLLG